MRTAPELADVVWSDALGTLAELLAIWSAAPARGGSPGPTGPASGDPVMRSGADRLRRLGRADLAETLARLEAAGRLTPTRAAQVDLLLALAGERDAPPEP